MIAFHYAIDIALAAEAAVIFHYLLPLPLRAITLILILRLRWCFILIIAAIDTLRFMPPLIIFWLY